MMELMNRITDKIRWDVKVFDEGTTRKWRKEAMKAKGKDVSEKMMDWVRLSYGPFFFGVVLYLDIKSFLIFKMKNLRGSQNCFLCFLINCSA